MRGQRGQSRGTGLLHPPQSVLRTPGPGIPALLCLFLQFFLCNAESESHTHGAFPGRKGSVLPQQKPRHGRSHVGAAGASFRRGARATVRLKTPSPDQSKRSGRAEPRQLFVRAEFGSSSFQQGQVPASQEASSLYGAVCKLRAVIRASELLRSRTQPRHILQPAVAGSPPTPAGALQREAAPHIPPHKAESSAWHNSKPQMYGP